MSKIVSIKLNPNILTRSSQFSDRRNRIIIDIVQDNDFEVINLIGDYDLFISIVENKLLIKVNDNQEFIFPLSRLRQIIKDYKVVCDSYFEAIKSSDTKKIEAIDMGRRGLHNEGAEIFQDYFENEIKMSFETARKMFSLIFLVKTK